MIEKENKKLLLDEVELYYRLLEIDIKDKINILTCKEISELIKEKYNEICDERDIFLLHEPTLEDLILDSQIHYGIINY